LPVSGVLECAFLASPLTDRDPIQYRIAGILLLIGVALCPVNQRIRSVREDTTPAEC
jgi:hypothetical protein